ncbi:MAG: sigma-70 family RNA polymerase sigma factor [Candidatus Limnocylindrales bacterium]
MDGDLRDRDIDQAYRSHAPEVYRVAFGILRNPDDALDATHEAFARAWERWDQYDSQRPLLAWLHGIVVHQALDQLRRNRVRRLAAPIVASANSARTSTPDIATDIARRGMVEQAMARLEPRARVALVLRHYYGYDYEALAGFLQIKEGTVGSMLSRAHASLRRDLTPEYELVVNEPSRHPSGERVADEPEVTP